jgi:hypothetical protein
MLLLTILHKKELFSLLQITVNSSTPISSTAVGVAAKKKQQRFHKKISFQIYRTTGNTAEPLTTLSVQHTSYPAH